MTFNSAHTHSDNPHFRSALRHLQAAEWEPGLAELAALAKTFPNDAGLRGLFQEMQLRARIDDYERQEEAEARRRRLLRLGIRLALAAIALLVIIWGVSTYAAWMGEQVALARQNLELQIQTVELAATFRNGQELLAAGRPTEALAVFKEISERAPQYPGLNEAVVEAERLYQVDSKYNEALRLINLEDYAGAQVVLEQITEIEPFYKDVNIRLTEIQSHFLLGDLLKQANQAYQSEQWVQAASGYETIRALDPAFDTEYIEEQLFNCYMNSAVAALADGESPLEALETAEEYFRKALALRPQDPVIKLEREQARQTFKDRLYQSYVQAAQAALVTQPDSLEAQQAAEEYFRKALELRPDDEAILQQRQLARLFVGAVGAYTRGQYGDAIGALEEVYAAEPEYANGTARQALYEAYQARGASWLASAQYEAALADFQRAAVLAGESPGNPLRLYAAQIKIAEAQGAMGEQQKAVQVYQAALAALDLGAADLEGHQALVDKLAEADRLARLGNYRSAYREYKDAAPGVLIAYPRVNYTVGSGDYLAQIASRYNTTVEAILKANDLLNAKQINVGQELVIPVASP